MIELKAELLKKRQELELERQRQESKKRPEKRLKTGAVTSTTSTANATNADDNDVLEQSKRALEAKSRLYAKLERGLLDEKDLTAQQRDGLLVDFTWKGWNPETEEYEFSEESDESDDNSRDIQSNTGPLQYWQVLELPEERWHDWVEMIDEFGRHRVLRPVDLRSLLQERSEASRLCSRYSADSELRNKGVGFYAFAGDEQGRAEQMEALKRLRAETMEARTRALLMREQRRLQLERRLAALKAEKEASVNK